MPAVFERTFRVRYDECDASGHVTHANYLRFMQEAAFDASADIGYDFATYERMNRSWFVRETEISFLHPLQYGDTLIVKTWVADFRRVRSQRRYEFRLQSSGQIVAYAFSDWVFLDTVKLCPARIPQQMITAFIPNGQDPKPLERHSFPASPEPPTGVHRCHRRVNWTDIDGAQHVNNAVYLTYLEDCENEMLYHKGWSLERSLQAGFGIVARNFRIEYQLPALMDDDLEIATWLSDVQPAAAVRHYTILRSRDKQLLTRARALLECVDLESGRPIPIPAEYRADLLANMANGKSVII